MELSIGRKIRMIIMKIPDKRPDLSRLDPYNRKLAEAMWVLIEADREEFEKLTGKLDKIIDEHTTYHTEQNGG